ncbi:MAG: histidinol phosphate phosphatase [Thermoflexaceae bacterium]|nr:histidinol phosphate phosphatase [Thermoflexaceae bacterium]
MSELAILLEIARRAAAIAGEVIMPLYTAGIPVELKADRTPVTEADRRAEMAIREFLQRECPGHGVLGEEFGETTGDGRHRWILDPIDGTKSFIHHVPLFGTLVALEVDGEPIVGVIACHAAGETAYAARGLGAFINGSPARVSTTPALGEATVLMTSFQHLPESRPAAFRRLIAGAGLLRTWGDCYGYLAVAAGRADVMLDPVMNIWDVAALFPVITEAGGQLTTWDGDPRPGSSAVATNGLLHPTVLAFLQEESAQPGGE